MGSIIIALGVALLGARQEKAKAAISSITQDATTRVEEWDRLLKNCRSDSELARKEADENQLKYLRIASEKLVIEGQLAATQREIDYLRSQVGGNPKGANAQDT